MGIIVYGSCWIIVWSTGAPKEILKGKLTVHSEE
jgi:hypothetical protein